MIGSGLASGGQDDGILMPVATPVVVGPVVSAIATSPGRVAGQSLRHSGVGQGRAGRQGGSAGHLDPPSSIRVWAGQRVHCHGGLKVVVKQWPDGRDKCKVSPFDGPLDRSPSRSRSRSRTPVLSPLRPGQSGFVADPTMLESPSVAPDSRVADSLPLGLDTNILEFLGGQ